MYVLVFLNMQICALFRSVTEGGQCEGGKSQAEKWKSGSEPIHWEFNVSIKRVSVDKS